MSLPALFIPIPSPPPQLPSEDKELNKRIRGHCYPPQKRNEDDDKEEEEGEKGEEGEEGEDGYDNSNEEVDKDDEQDHISTVCYDEWIVNMIESAEETLDRARRKKRALPNTLLFTSAGAGILELMATKTFNDTLRTIERVVMIDTGVTQQMAEDVVHMFEMEFLVNQNITVDYFYGTEAYANATAALNILPLTLLVSGAINEGGTYQGDVLAAFKKEFAFWDKLSSIAENRDVGYVSAYVSFEDSANSTYTLNTSTVLDMRRKALKRVSLF